MSEDKKTWFVYVLRYRGRGFGGVNVVKHYTGISTDPDARFRTHCRGKGALALRGVIIEALVWRSPCPVGRGPAQRAEYAIKQLPPRQKAEAAVLARVFANHANSGG